jgi:hypothetical protein
MDFYEQGDLCLAIAQQQGSFEESVLYQWVLSALRGLAAMHSSDMVSTTRHASS